MRVFVAIALALVPVAAGAQDPFPSFSEPPAGIADFVPNIVNPSEKSAAVVDLPDAGDSIADEAVRAGLCSTGQTACSLVISTEVVRQHRCIAQDDSERPCGLRMAWKRMEVTRIAVRYLMSRNGRRSEGLAVSDRASGDRYFVLGHGPEAAWGEIPAENELERARQGALIVALMSRL